MYAETGSLPRDDAEGRTRLRRVYRLQAVDIPILRIIGFTSVAFAVALHDRFVLGAFSFDTFRGLAVTLLLYCAVSWIALHFYYRVERARTDLDLASLFHFTDIAFCALAVHASGGAKSWLFVLLLVPVLNQMHNGAARAVFAGAMAATIYFLMLFAEPSLPVPHALVGAGLLLLTTVYCCLAALVVERRRKQLTVAIQRERAIAEQRAARLTSLSRLTQTVTSAGELPAVLDAAAREMVTLFEATSCAITIRDRRKSLFRVLAVHSVDPNAADVRGLECEYDVESRKPIIVSDVPARTLPPDVRAALSALNVSCMMLVPLVAHGETIGTFSIHTADRNRVFTTEETELAETAASQIAPVIGMARKYEEERSSRQLAQRLRDAVQAISVSLELDEVLGRILGNLHEVVAFDAASIQLLEGESMRVIAVKGHQSSEIGRVRDLNAFPYNRRLATDPEPLILNLPEREEMWPAEEQFGAIRTVLGLPLLFHDQIIGAMTIDSKIPNAYSASDADAAMSFARFAAVAVEHARLYKSVLALSNADGLTGIGNRRHFEQTYAVEWRRAERTGSALSLLMIDVDDFKTYNDHEGHRAGDLVLSAVAESLRGGLQRAGDFVARYGGEEFAVLLPAADLHAASAQAERLRARIEQLAIPHPHAQAAPFVTISIGAATATPKRGDDDNALIIAADQQLYVAKRRGRNQVSSALVDAQGVATACSMDSIA